MVGLLFSALRDILLWGLAILLPSLMGLLSMSYVSPHGFMVSPDSVYYLMGAEGFRRGLGFVSFEAGGKTSIISHWPPFYSILLSLFSPQIIGYISLLLTIVIVQIFVWDATRRWGLMLLSGLLVATSPVVLKFSTSILSDMPFVALLLLILFLLYGYARKGDDRLLLVLAILSSFLVLTRYAGIFVSLVLFVYLWRKRVSIWKNLLVSSVPILTFILYKGYLFLMGAPETRYLSFHPPSMEHLYTFLETLVMFVSYYPEILSRFTIYIIFLFMVVLLAILKRKSLSPNAKELLFLSVITWLSYLIFLFIAITFFDFYTLPDDRILLPLYPLLVISLAIVLSMYFPVVWMVVIGGLLVINLLNLPYLRAERLLPFSGYNAPEYDSLEILEYVKGLPEDAIIYSNAPDLIWYRTRRPASMVPKVVLPVTHTENPHYEEDMLRMIGHLTSGKGYIVWFDFINRTYLTPIEVIAAVVPFERAIEFPYGLVLVVKNEE